MRIFVFSIFSSLYLFSCFPFSINRIREPSSDYIFPVEFEKTRCLGKCSAYKIQINHKGKAVLEGIANMDMIGKYSRKLSHKENKSFWKLIDSSQLDTLKEEYDYGAEDTQQKFLRLFSRSDTKEIRFGNSVPDALTKIDAEIEKIIAGKNWKKLSP